jgi:hypothetical protein
MTKFQLIYELLNPRIKVVYSNNFDGAVAVIAAPFNRYLPGSRPDDSNSGIAKIAQEYCTKLHMPFCGQKEQSSILEDMVVLYTYPSSPGEWVQTHVLLKWVARQIRRMYEKPIVVLVGHPHHVRRVALLAQYYGLTVAVPGECDSIPYDRSWRVGCQWWCRSPWLYIPWEYCSRAFLIIKALCGKL